MTSYLDTSVAVWLAQGDLARITAKALEHLRGDTKLLISPMVLLELEYLFEIKRILLPPRDLQIKLMHELGVHVCDLSFQTIGEFAQAENWTRDPFDRLIVAHAKSNCLAWLISSDAEIAEHYPRTIW